MKRFKGELHRRFLAVARTSKGAASERGAGAGSHDRSRPSDPGLGSIPGSGVSIAFRPGSPGAASRPTSRAVAVTVSVEEASTSCIRARLASQRGRYLCQVPWPIRTSTVGVGHSHTS